MVRMAEVRTSLRDTLAKASGSTFIFHNLIAAFVGGEGFCHPFGPSTMKELFAKRKKFFELKTFFTQKVKP
jgi:hypothetical protein